MAKKKIDYASLYTLRPDGRYQGYYRDSKGRHTVCDKDPKKLYEKIQAKESAPEKVITFKDVAELWQVEHAEKLSRGTQKTYKAPLQKVISESGHLPIAEVDAAEINRVLLAEKSQGYSYKHAATVKSIYKQVLDFAIIKKYIAINPTPSVSVPRGMKRGKIESPDEDVIDIITANLDKPFGAFVAFLLYTGARTEEVAALRWSDIDNGYINISRAVDLHGTPIIKETKTEAGSRQVPILPPLLPFIQNPSDGYIFNIAGKLLTRGQINSRWLNWCKAAGLAHQETYDNRRRGERKCSRTEWRPDLKPHQLRHHYATVLFESGIDEMTAADLMGHEDISTTREIYTSLRKKHKQAAVEKLISRFN